MNSSNQTVQFTQVDSSMVRGLLRCLSCAALVVPEDEFTHRSWHANHQSEHERISDSAERYVPPPRYG